MLLEVTYSTFNHPHDGSNMSADLGTSARDMVLSAPDAKRPSDLWNQDKDRSLATALNSPKLGEGDLFNGFRQTTKGNQATVAVLKAARQTENGYDVVLRDGNQVTVSRSELTTASAGARLEGTIRRYLPMPISPMRSSPSEGSKWANSSRATMIRARSIPLGRALLRSIWGCPPGGGRRSGPGRPHQERQRCPGS